MAGTTIQLVKKRVIDFTNFTTGFTPRYILAQRIDVSEYIDGILSLRLHALNVASGNQINFDLYGEGYTEDDPGFPFLTVSPLFTSANILSSLPAPFLFTYGGTVPGHYATLIANCNKFAAGTCTATVSIDLILRTPDDS